MNMVQILQLFAAIATVAIGIWALARPKPVQQFTGLKAQGARGLSEIRATFGGLLVALGLAPIVLGAPVTYRMLGIGYIGVAVVRAASIIIDKSTSRTNIISLVAEILLGTFLVQ